MDNYDFFVEKIRFSLDEKESDKKILLVRGWFRDDNPEGRKIVIEINDSRVDYELSSMKGIEVRQRYLFNKANVSEEITCKVKLDMELSEIRTLKVYSVLENDGEATEKKLVEKTTGARLKRVLEQVPCYVESKTFEDGKVIVVGWAIDLKEVQIELLQNGTPIDATVTTNYRRDVSAVFPEVDKHAKAGFKVEAKVGSNKGLAIRFTAGDKTTVVPVKYSKNNGEPSSVEKVAYWLKTYGLSATVNKIMIKATGGKLALGEVSQDEFTAYRKKYLPTKEDLDAQRKESFEYSPRFSIVIPLYDTKEQFLKEMVESVIEQTYGNWQLCLADGSADNHLWKTIQDIATRSGLSATNVEEDGNGLETANKAEVSDSKYQIVYKHLTDNLGISENTNAAIALATGDFIVLADHDDIMAPDALYECVRALNMRKEEIPAGRDNLKCENNTRNGEGISENGIWDVLYSDEDKVDMSGKKYFEPHFKSDYNVDLLCSMNYICHLFVVRKTIVDMLIDRDGAAIRKEFDGAQDHDFIFRCCEVAGNIYHIPKLLYHWRCHINSTASNPESKMYAFEAGRKAVEEHYRRVNIPATVEHGQFYGIYRTKYHWKEKPLVSIIIPNKDHIDDLKKCIDSIDERSTYKNYEFIVVENNSTETETFEYYKEIEARDNVTVLYYKDVFNFSRINNFGAQAAKGEYLLLLNNDTELISPDGLWELLAPCMREDVGIVGARLYYDDDTVQHGGVTLGFGGMAGHSFIGMNRYDNGYFNRLICAQDLSAVTAACLMVKKSVFDQVGGLTEELVVAFNDIDFCMKVRSLGKLVVYNPQVELYHYESKSRGLEDTPEKIERFNSEVARFIEKWNKELMAGDPYYNVNLTLDKADFSIRE